MLTVLTKVTLQARILREAYRLYATEGSEGFSLRRIARALRVTAPAIYRHFRSKAALLEAVADRGFEAFEASLARALDDVRGPRKRALCVLEAYLDFALAEPRLFEIMFLTARPKLRRFPRDFKVGRSATFNRLWAEVKAGMGGSGAARQDPFEASLGLWAQAHGLIALERTGRFGRNRAAFKRIYRRSLGAAIQRIG